MPTLAVIFRVFLITNIQHIYNPKSQAIFKCAHFKLKIQLVKQNNGGIQGQNSSQMCLNFAIHVLNFLNPAPDSGLLPDMLHWGQESTWSQRSLPSVVWQDFYTGVWNGPASLLNWRRGHAYILTGNGEILWIPS